MPFFDHMVPDLALATSQSFKSTHLSVPSPCGKHIATLNGSRLEIREVLGLEVVRHIDVPLTKRARYLSMSWGPIGKEEKTSTRLLLVDEDATRVWDLRDEQWSATIDNGSGGMGKIAHAGFGRDRAEVLVFSEFGARVLVWSLDTGKRVEMRDPKSVKVGYGWGYRARDGVFALLTRYAAQDVVSLHAPGSYGTIESFALPTIDAQGLKWSPDGKWMAVWEAASAGYKVRIYTADGHLYRTYSGDSNDESTIGLGVRCIEWSPQGDFLAVGGHADTVTLLNARTFSAAAWLTHPHAVMSPEVHVWQEQATSSDRSYSLMAKPANIPTGPAQTAQGETPLVGISSMKFNADGSLLATRHDSMPTTVWIWDVERMVSKAVLVQHAIIKRLLWHPTDPNSLLVQCAQDEPIIYLWDASGDHPRMLDASRCNIPGRLEARWMHTPACRKPIIMVGNTHGFALAFPDGRDDESGEGVVASEMSGRATEEDDLFLHLSSIASPIGGAGTSEIDAQVEDTFLHRQHAMLNAQ